MPSDPDSPGSNRQTYIDVASKLLQLAAEAKSADSRQQFLALATLYQKLARSSRDLEWPPLPPPVSLADGIMASSWQGNFLPYRRETVLAHAPSAPGVYALWTSSHWVYIGESADLRSRLLAHLEGDDDCIIQNGARGFGFEFIENPSLRAARAQALIQELLPVCNPLPG
jgi:hypothetical protein